MDLVVPCVFARWEARLKASHIQELPEDCHLLHLRAINDINIEAECADRNKEQVIGFR